MRLPLGDATDDARRRRGNRRVGWGRRARRGGTLGAPVWLVGLAVALVGGIAVVVLTAPVPFLTVEEVLVEGTREVPAAEIRRAAGLAEGMPLFRLRPEAVAERVRRHPWVQEVAVRRVPPHRVILLVREREPVALVRLGDWAYVDRDGMILPLLGRHGRGGYPIITLAAAERGAPGAPEAARPLLRRAVVFLEAARSAPFPRPEQVSEIHVDGRGDLSCFLVGTGTEIRLGTTGYAEKLTRLHRVRLAYPSMVGAAPLIDLRFPPQVVVRQ